MKITKRLTVIVGLLATISAHTSSLEELYSSPPKETKKGYFEYDHNNDKITDRVIQKSPNLEIELIDRNQNKFFETKIMNYAGSLLFKERYRSSKDDGVYDEKKTYKIIGSNRIEVTTFQLKNSKYEVISTDFAKNEQEQNCTSPNTMLKTLSQKITDLKSLYSGADIKTPYGFLLTKGCLDRYGAADITNSIQGALHTGLSCLNKLTQNYYKTASTPIPVAAHNMSKLSDMLQSKTTSVTLICDDNSDPKRWDRAMAFASTGPSSKKIEGKYSHPYINVSPKYRWIKPKTEDDNLDKVEFQKTIFHELMHTLGYLHYDDIEYSYNCEECCFKKNIDMDSPSCRICTGAYDDINAETYFDDLVQVGNETDNFDSIRHIVNRINKSSNSRERTFKLFRLNDDYSQFQQALYEILEKKFTKKTYSESLQLSLIAEKKLPPATEDHKNVIRAFLSFYVDRDVTSASKAISRIKNIGIFKDPGLKKIAQSITSDMYDFNDKIPKENQDAFYKLFIELH